MKKITLDNNRKKAVKQLQKLGFGIRVIDGEIAVKAPDGTNLGHFSSPVRAKHTPYALQANVNRWLRGHKEGIR